LIGCLFPIPRILYAMSSDGLLFSFLATMNERTKTPFIAAIICGVCAGMRWVSNTKSVYYDTPLFIYLLRFYGLSHLTKVSSTYIYIGFLNNKKTKFTFHQVLYKIILFNNFKRIRGVHSSKGHYTPNMFI